MSEQASREAENERVRMLAVNRRWSGRPYWARTGYDKNVAHRFQWGEITGSHHGAACGLWTTAGGVPVGDARQCRRCEALLPC